MFSVLKTSQATPEWLRKPNALPSLTLEACLEPLPQKGNMWVGKERSGVWRMFDAPSYAITFVEPEGKSEVYHTLVPGTALNLRNARTSEDHYRAALLVAAYEFLANADADSMSHNQYAALAQIQQERSRLQIEICGAVDALVTFKLR